MEINNVNTIFSIINLEVISVFCKIKSINKCKKSLLTNYIVTTLKGKVN